MDEGRLYQVNRTVASKRKMTAIHNDQARGVLDVASKSLMRQKTITEWRFNKESRPYQSKLVRTKLYNEALRRHRESISSCDSNENFRLGQYGGATLRDVKPIINKIINWNLPDVKRRRNTQTTLDKAVVSGKVLDHDEALRKMRDISDRPFPKFEPKKASKDTLKLPPIHVTNKNFLLRRNTEDYHKPLKLKQRSYSFFG